MKAIGMMSLADAYAIFFAAPLLITILSGPVLGEKAGPYRLAAAVVGFAGVLIVLQPGMNSQLISYGAVMGLLAMVAYAFMALLLRRMGHHDSTVAIAFWLIALAAAGLFCTIDNLARFACAELNGGEQVISRQGMATLYERQCYAESLEEMDFDAALGHFRLDIGDNCFVHHTGGVPGWRSVYGVIPQTGHGFCALINSDGGNQFWIELLRAWE